MINIFISNYLSSKLCIKNISITAKNNNYVSFPYDLKIKIEISLKRFVRHTTKEKRIVLHTSALLKKNNLPPEWLEYSTTLVGSGMAPLRYESHRHGQGPNLQIRHSAHTQRGGFSIWDHGIYGRSDIIIKSATVGRSLLTC